MFKSKTKEEFKPLRARVFVYSSGSAEIGLNGTADPASDHHKFDLGEGEFHALHKNNESYGNQVLPALDIDVPGIGTLSLTPGEVHRLLVAFEQIQKRIRHPAAYSGPLRACTETVTP